MLTPEDTYDLWVIRRIIEKDDEVEASTTREVKQEGDFVRPDKGRRKKVRVKLRVEHTAFDSELGRLRIRGVIVDSNDEVVGRGSYHSVEVLPFTTFYLWKDNFKNWQVKLLSKRLDVTRIIVVAVDTREAGIGVLSGLSLNYAGTIRSDIGGKQFEKDEAKLLKEYLSDVTDFVIKVNAKYNAAGIVVVGPGLTKNLLANQLAGRLETRISVIDGFDTAGEDGVRVALNDTRFKDVIKGSLYEKAQMYIENAKLRLAKNDNRLAMGYESSRKAAEFGAVDALIISDEVFKVQEESNVVDLANLAESSGAEVILLDSSTLLGVQVSRMGGVIALLRYPVL